MSWNWFCLTVQYQNRTCHCLIIGIVYDFQLIMFTLRLKQQFLCDELELRVNLLFLRHIHWCSVVTKTIRFGNSFGSNVNINMYTNFKQNIPYGRNTYGDFHIFIFLVWAMPRSVKGGVWQASWLDVVSINLLAKHYQSIHYKSGVMPLFANWPPIDRRMDSQIEQQTHCESRPWSVGLS